MKKALVSILLTSLFLSSCSPGKSSGLKNLKIGNTRIQVEIAKTPQELAKGLSGRSGIAADRGMLFIFDYKDYYEFWMKDVQFPLDFIWINGDKVVDITPSVQPPLFDGDLKIYKPQEPVDKVLEVKADFTFFHQIKAGDRIDLED
jgi:hypothetical protein